jgi:hypothetical protein
LVLLAWRDGKRGTAWLNLVLREAGRWEGTLDLTKPEDRAWIENYTSEIDKKKMVEIFSISGGEEE